jgi:hypothetical protein
MEQEKRLSDVKSLLYRCLDEAKFCAEKEYNHKKDVAGFAALALTLNVAVALGETLYDKSRLDEGNTLHDLKKKDNETGGYVADKICIGTFYDRSNGNDTRQIPNWYINNENDAEGARDGLIELRNAFVHSIAFPSCFFIISDRKQYYCWKWDPKAKVIAIVQFVETVRKTIDLAITEMGDPIFTPLEKHGTRARVSVKPPMQDLTKFNIISASGVISMMSYISTNTDFTLE